MRCLFCSLHTSVSQSTGACRGLHFPLHTSVSQSTGACSVFVFVTSHISITKQRSIYMQLCFHFALQYHKEAKHAESFLPLHTSVSQSTVACGVFFAACGVFFLLVTAVSRSSAACGVFFWHFTLQHHKAPQHVVFPPHYILQYHTVPQHAVSFFCQFTVQYHKVAQHAVSFLCTSHFSITK